MNFFEKEMRSLFDSNNILTDMKFTGKTLLGKLDDNKLCKMKFVISDTVNKYTGIQAKIINSNEGVIDTQTFNFSDIIGMQKIRDDDIEPHIWVYNQKPDWYLPVNASQKAEIADAILDYIEMFQEQNYGLNIQFK